MNVFVNASKGAIEMPSTPEKPEDSAANFFKRWSDRKAQSIPQTEADTQAGPAPTESDAQAALADDQLSDVSEENTADTSTAAAPSVTEADLENLTYDSDYTKFMSDQVPEALRRRALRQLWRSDPILANLDGLCDYDDDYTDAALAVATLQTAHKVGQGYLTDEEVAANRARGGPPTDEAQQAEQSTVATADDETPEIADLDDTEDMDDESDDDEILTAETAPADASSNLETTSTSEAETITNKPTTGSI